MTIISVVYVPEGIAMAADSTLTGSRTENGIVERYTITDNAQKLVLVRNSTIGVAFCGIAILNGKTVSDILKTFDITHVLQTDTVDEVANKLSSYIKTNYGEIDIAFLMAGFDQDIPYLYAVGHSVVIHKNTPAEEFGITWNGEILPVQNALTNFNLNTSLMPLKDAADFAEFVVDFTIKYQRFDDRIPTCGGPIDLLVITKDYTKFLKHKILQP